MTKRHNLRAARRINSLFDWACVVMVVFACSSEFFIAAFLAKVLIEHK